MVGFDRIPRTRTCPAGEAMWLRSELIDKLGHAKIFFEGRFTKCCACHLKQECLRNPDSLNTRKGHGRQVSFIIAQDQRGPNYTDRMKHRIDSEHGKHIYSDCMSVVEPCLPTSAQTKDCDGLVCAARRRSRSRDNCIVRCITSRS